MSKTADSVPRRELPSASHHYPDIVRRLGGAQSVIFLDYDGVLTPIICHPDLAVLSAEMRHVLTDLAAATTVAVVSGRDVADVRDKVRLPGIYYAGSHGFDMVGPDGQPVVDEELEQFHIYLDPLDRLAGVLGERLGDIAGARIEKKRFAVAVHYRQVADKDYPAVESAVTTTAPQFPLLRVETGKKIFEFRPDFAWDKGRALEWLLGELNLLGPEVVPVYIGDDTTDEDAFRVVRGDGIGIVVGRDGAPSLAHYVLEDTDEVQMLLARLAADLRADSGKLN
jgi:trehalose 6-phosphate phosphatase